MTAILIPESDLWAIRERALAVLIEIAEDTHEDTGDRGTSAAIVLEDIRLHMDRTTDQEIAEQEARIIEVERTAAELREALASRG